MYERGVFNKEGVVVVHSGAELSVLLRVKTKVSRWIRLHVYLVLAALERNVLRVLVCNVTDYMSVVLLGLTRQTID